ncbi:c-type cytochrome [Calidithermus chliarophilus]|uniref:c-type cytochrome n=1 Tax=Calidithermus chliarophilus TaxID=52023 RepID=UPI0004224696|nr:cytochrome c [Calidithermus chliarophilus]
MRGLLALALLLAACAPQRVSIANYPELEATRGEALFMRYCHQCHPNGAAGLGPSLNDKPLPGFLIALQVRVGLGAMPAFGRDLISDAELDELVAYVQALHRVAGER